jgi:lipopolysaccharide/colanic/teichoic acid biosynthesis glycosyltransferase
VTIGPHRFSEACQRAIKRGFDVSVAAFGLLLGAPVMILIALAIRAETKGPIFFSQIRLGLHGRHFRLYKFRKFRHDQSPGCTVTLKDDPRMTAVGRFLERMKLDELPQLWNVLIGDMSIVGPRPESLHFADCFTDRFQRVLEYRPGLFGPSQVLFRDEGRLFPKDQDPVEFYRAVLFPAKASIDLSYFPHRTLLSDIGWIARSLAAVLRLPIFSDHPNAVIDATDIAAPRTLSREAQEVAAAAPADDR